MQICDRKSLELGRQMAKNVFTSETTRGKLNTLISNLFVFQVSPYLEMLDIDCCYHKQCDGIRSLNEMDL